MTAPHTPDGAEIDPQRRLKALIDTTGLEGHLFDSSARSVRESLEACGDWVSTAEAAGQALELLAKAVVFRRDPPALARVRKDLREGAAAFLKGLGHQDVWSLADITTVTGPDAVKTAYQLLGEPLETSWLDAVFHARNRAVHMAQAEPEDALRGLVHCMFLAVPLLRDLDKTADDWVGPDRGLHEIAAAAVDAVRSVRTFTPFEVVAKSKRWRAQQEWSDLRTRLPADVLTDLAADPRVRPDAEDVHMALCPAGGHYAWFEVGLEESDVQDTEGEVAYDVLLVSLECPLCGLEVEYYELDALGMGRAVETRYHRRD